ncbi:phosphotransferase [Lipingzhangella sp. LS1_29]|uniref:Phosphotransferase n=1 Tax=Lipingzhangella rawalii TaxID=2055835 RepID=A0ABU2H1L7_9ACTN|nr:phosphotransferase [Lipingzhangella rawalii]MDS1268749.1 phosphotransferase [Lipingzhangella rawalii]
MSTGPRREPPHSRRYHETATQPELRLPAGDVTEGVVRVGDTVRRPHQPQSLAVAEYLDHLERVGFPGSPRYLGRDDSGRDVLTFLPGHVPGDPVEPWATDERLLTSVGRLLRALHTASAGFAADRGFAAPAGSTWRRDLVPVHLPAPEPQPELVSHLDVTPQNVVVRDGEAVGLVDFDLAGPTTRLTDLYNTAMHWVPLCAPEDLRPPWDVVDQLSRLRALVDAYGATSGERSSLLDLGIARADVSWERMRASAEQLGGGWARMWRAGVGDMILRRKRWLVSRRAELAAALV